VEVSTNVYHCSLMPPRADLICTSLLCTRWSGDAHQPNIRQDKTRLRNAERSGYCRAAKLLQQGRKYGREIDSEGDGEMHGVTSTPESPGLATLSLESDNPLRL
jgi:hypothetical protein